MFKVLLASAFLGGAALLPVICHAHGCLKGAAVGGVVGHVADHHAVVGAAVGCVIGHHRAKVHEREAAQSGTSTRESRLAGVPAQR